MSSRSRTNQYCYQIGHWTITPAKLQIRGPMGQVTLPAKAFEVIKLLIAQPGETVSRDQFVAAIWRGHKDVGDKALNQAIWQLRRAFADTGCDSEVIGTVARMGYVLLHTVAESADHSAQTRAAHNQPWWLLAALALVPMATVVWALKPQALQPTPLQQRPVILSHYKGAEETPAFTADGRFMAFQWDKGSGLPGIYTVDLAQTGSEPQRISADDEFGASPTFSPDGSQLAYAVIDGKDCRVKIQHLSDGASQFIDNCYGRNIVNTLSWSRTANQLAYAYRNTKGGISIKGYNADNAKFSQLTAEQSDFEDYPLAWANHSDTLAYASLKGGLGNIYLRTKNGRIRALLKEPQAIYSLAFSPDDSHLYFGTAWHSEVTILQVSLKDGSISPLSFEATPGRIAVRPGLQPQLVYSRYTSMEQLVKLQPDGTTKPLPFSYGRELYPLYSASADKLVFFSNKSGGFQLWAAAADSEFASKIVDISGSAYIHALSNRGDKFLLPVKQNGDNYYSLYLGNFDEQPLQQLPQINYPAKNFSWGINDDSILFSSDLNGQWQIWRHYLATGIREQLTLNGGLFAQDGYNSELFVVKPAGGIWRLSTGQPAELLVEQLSSKDWGNWLLGEEGILYVQRTATADLIKLQSWAGEQQLIASLPPRTIKTGRSITQLPDGSLILSMYQSKEADIVAIDLATP
ncbi:winged helix-turn-helix domain-containing protein [Rheinheimera pacifica]|uniref:winged helix-turn-helix domain-containing protein n=1 Tax=Rheinheimera pacifica TaxID=173990 RepID=UPI002EDA7778